MLDTPYFITMVAYNVYILLKRGVEEEFKLHSKSSVPTKKTRKIV